MYKFFVRIYQQILKVYVSTFNVKKTQIYHEPDSSSKVGEILKNNSISNILIITDTILYDLGLLNIMLQGLDRKNIKYYIYKDVVPNPTTHNVMQAKDIYLQNNCQAIVAFGGGSVIDCAKMTGVVVLTKKNVRRYDFIIPLIPRMAKIFAVPTTAGTGSEVTLTAVITDELRHKKMAITDLKLAPDFAFLDANLMTGLPKNITSTTGIDALTHAIEAFIGNWKFKFTDENAVKAVHLIFDWLEKAYKDGDSIEARNNMAIASTYGGYAFRTGGVGYVHAIAHRLSELYGVSHGLANAIVLPHVLDYSFNKIYKKLADLSKRAGVADASKDDIEIARDFVEKVKELNRNLEIPNYAYQIKKEDIDLIAKRAIKEANSTYPVPKVMTVNEMRLFLDSIRGENTQ